jgi:hypothetical protein
MNTEEQKLRQLFKNNSDCYADTHYQIDTGETVEGEVVQAMTEDKFIEVLASLRVAEANTRSTLLLKEVRKRLLFDVDDNGHPKSTMTDLMNMWDNINAELQSPPTK